MNGGSDRFRHRNNYDPFFVTISATAKNGFVIAYLDVSATVGVSGEVDFHVIRGATGSKTMTFQLVSNHSDFLSYSYLAYGIREEEYKKISNIITLPR
ncbi:putative ectonucleoside triphosphate diphosphohydrolase 1 [Operophtera brumata]|uniref:Putative ectonucleoside triphosphate diphosphohydrolase 1 n=1 Tax=Operophtera brumata TaxID=104452 RepID=A0A0L7LHC3_OPEBR|nr:putative ectonucleoside triphosphate diphosphohydrolase 1 [Operophtera brumata]